MLIGVLSDTHLREGRTLPARVWEELSKVNIILHAGDILNSELLADLSAITTVFAVRGNCDAWSVGNLPDQRVILCEGKRIGLTHGAYGIGKNTPERAFRTFEKGTVDVIVFGHSHAPYLEWREGVLLFNPGSPTDKRQAPKYSMGILEIHEHEILARHIYF